MGIACAGAAYEKSPVTDQVRIPTLPDNDRFWLSAGATYKWSPKITLDFAYSHIFVKNAPINDVAGNPFFPGTGGGSPTPAPSTRTSTSCRWRCGIAGTTRQRRPRWATEGEVTPTDLNVKRASSSDAGFFV